MVCRGCKHEFCWVCLGVWADHGQKTGGYYTCNRYDAQRAAKSTGGTASTGSDAERAKMELDRYLFYFQRYSNHHSAGKFAERQRSNTQHRMTESAAQGRAWTDVQHLEHGTEVLLACRRVLKYTYVLGYYMEDGAEKALFEHLQEMLEGSTEQLSELLEQDMDSVSREAVVNYTRVTSKFLAQLLDGLDEGLTDAGSLAVRARAKQDAEMATRKAATGASAATGPTAAAAAAASSSSSSSSTVRAAMGRAPASAARPGDGLGASAGRGSSGLARAGSGPTPKGPTALGARPGAPRR